MFTLNSHIDRSDPDYRANFQSNKFRLDDFKEALFRVQSGGNPDAVKKHKSRGKMLARERIELLLDPGTPFIEFSALAAWGQYDDAFPSAGIVTGIGVIRGRESVIIANDATVKGGTYIKETIKKHIRAQEIALQNHLPCVYMVDRKSTRLNSSHYS